MSNLIELRLEVQDKYGRIVKTFSKAVESPFTPSKNMIFNGEDYTLEARNVQQWYGGQYEAMTSVTGFNKALSVRIEELESMVMRVLTSGSSPTQTCQLKDCGNPGCPTHTATPSQEEKS
jgi:hypothetical protein